jgi:hypothetical protein
VVEVYVDYLQVTIPVAALIINAVVQLLSARAWLRWGFVRSAGAGFVAGLVGLLALDGLAHFFYRRDPWQEAVATLLVNMGTYVALAYCFIAGFVNLGKTSLRIRIFSELYYSKFGLSMEQLLSLYNSRVIVELRLDRLLNNNQVVERDDRYFLNGALLWFVAVVIRSAKMLVLGKTGGVQPGKRGRAQPRELTSLPGLPPP